MNIIQNCRNNFKAQPDTWFFFGFLATFTLTIRKVLFFQPIGGEFNEWTGGYLYLSDIFLALTLVSWLIYILRNNNTSLSNIISYFGLFKPILHLPLFLVIWSFLSIFWSENQNIALFKAIKMLEFYLLYLYVIYKLSPFVKGGLKGDFKNPSPALPFTKGESINVSRLPRETKMFHVKHFSFLRGETALENTFRIIIALGFIQAIIGILQFTLQRSVGLFWLFESHISPNVDGVAKILINGEKYIRIYGLFPHPNILGGFLLISIILTIYFPLCKRGIKRDFKYHSLWIALIIQATALILTFSKSAILGLFIAIIYIFRKNKKLFHVEQLSRRLLIFAIILILSLYLAGLNFGENLETSVSDRLEQFNVPRLPAGEAGGTILSNFWIGSGAGQYVNTLYNVSRGTLEYWQYQPIHNVFALILAELGFVGVFIFVWWLWKLFHAIDIVPRGTISSNPATLEQKEICHPERSETKPKDLIKLDSSATLEMMIFKSIVFGFIFIMLFDHYLWDIQQGQIMLWMMLGFLAGFINQKSN